MAYFCTEIRNLCTTLTRVRPFQGFVGTDHRFGQRTLHRGPMNVTPLSELRGCGPEANECMEIKRTPIRTLYNLGRIFWRYFHLERDYDSRNDTMRSPWWTQLNPTQELPI